MYFWPGPEVLRGGVQILQNRKETNVSQEINGTFFFFFFFYISS